MSGPLYRDTTANVPCPLTGSRGAVVIAERDRHGKPLRTVMSKASGLAFTDPRPTPDEVRRFYAEEYRVQYKQTATPKPKHIVRAGRLAQRRLSVFANRLAPGCRLLDAGAGGGEFVHLATRRGFAAQGVEPNRGYAEFAIREYGVPVFNGFYQDAPFQPEQFDCVTMFHVLEHLEQPVDALRLLAGWLRPGGTMVVEVPSLVATDTAPNQKWHLGHLYHFTEATLAATAVLAGLRPVRFVEFGNVFGVFEKPAAGEPAGDAGACLRGAFEANLRVLKSHTPLAHYSVPARPLLRVWSKASRAVSERRVTERYRDRRPAEMLNDLALGRVA
ncbi:class I SAM-dependent methyltransferase [Botrimarina sp.]|uniref:class I SAM-dependent methyltransferase n=1 Tax=Botrimarina sp. TaxID=2795802 RepID=UPI0032EB432A